MSPINNDFQETVDAMLIRHQSILDILSKGQEASSRVNRAITKAVTSCGCVSVDAYKSPIPENATISDLKFLLNSHLVGNLCSNCREVVETELGNQLFYISALANILGLSVNEILEKEENRLKTLTVFNFR
ncbi:MULTISPECIES: hypothetical protein [Dehalobacter]|jgi:hypothetical protein|uniref:DUF1573 domain-containing protein n=2 Tax=Dehalobacter restrictus TaxID=55583 RepID=A0A857DH46_9FIRM|nr:MULTISPECIES: hypothetical protein [Dehalobacter]AHF09074.1 hypothetical protein DEHRE_02370 [Dehalobacter restrictus DSM 9455]MDJ0306812.1 DUF1573 domain-containing protein [Dehalobacter sp.]QGZ99614.1 DUF1573 domain-containing protein [Dehalobacter restrictus]